MERDQTDGDETIDWYLLAPTERFQEFLKLWEVYILWGGLETEPDSKALSVFLKHQVKALLIGGQA